jgi:hypothetical protein
VPNGRKGKCSHLVNRTDLALGFLFLGFCGVVYLLMRGLPSGTLQEGMGPAFFPGCLVLVLACLSVILIFTGIFRKNGEGAKGDSGNGKPLPLIGPHLKIPGMLTLTVAIYLSILEVFGFLALTPIFIFMVIRIFRSSFWNASLMGLSITGAIYLIFGLGFQIPLPKGSFWGY